MPIAARAGAIAIIIAAFAAPGSASEAAVQLTPEQQSWGVLREGLQDTKAAKRAEAVRALSLLPRQPEAVRSAMRALSDKDEKVRTAAAATLGQLKAKSAIPALHKALEDKSISVMMAAAYSLLTLKDKSAYGIYFAILMGDKKTSEGMIQSQLDRLKDPKQVATIGVEEGLGFVPFGGMGLEAYRTLAKSDNSPVRSAAARFLAHDPDPVSEDALVQAALADKNEAVRKAALDALAERGDPKCIELLMKNLDDDKDAVRYRTAATIIHLSMATPAKNIAAPIKKNQ
jgi:HEAT repeat protein